MTTPADKGGSGGAEIERPPIGSHVFLTGSQSAVLVTGHTTRGFTYSGGNPFSVPRLGIQGTGEGEVYCDLPWFTAWSMSHNPPAPKSGPAGGEKTDSGYDMTGAEIPASARGHSPLPWRHCSCGNCGLIWSEKQDFCVADVQRENENGSITADQRRANAELIVHAVNSLLSSRNPVSAPAPSSGKAEGVWHMTKRSPGDWLSLLHKCQNGDASCMFVLGAINDELAANGAAAAEREKELREAHLAVIHYDEVIHEITGDESDDDGATVIQRHVADLRAQLTATREQLREREAEVARLKANIGCARNQGSTQFCHEAVDAKARVEVLEEALVQNLHTVEAIWNASVNSGVYMQQNYKDCFDRIRDRTKAAFKALTPPPPPAVDGRRGEGV